MERINSFQLRIAHYELRIKKVGSPQKAKLRLGLCVIAFMFGTGFNSFVEEVQDYTQLQRHSIEKRNS